MRNKTVNVLVRFAPDVKEELVETAKYKGLSMSGLITLLIREEYKKMLLEKSKLENK